MILNNENLLQFLTNNRPNSQKVNSNLTKKFNNKKIYNQSQSNINIENENKRLNLFSNLFTKPKEKNLAKSSKEEKNFYNNINLVTEHNVNKKHTPKELKINFSLLNVSKKGKENSFKTLNYDRPSFARVMKYYTIKSNNKPMKTDELSPIFIPIRNTLSYEHRRNNDMNNMNINSDNIKDKINFYYYIKSKEKAQQLFKDNKISNKKSSSNNSHREKRDLEGKENLNIIKNNFSDNINGNIKINNINLINKNELRNSNAKNSENNLTFSKNSNESEFTFKEKGSSVFNIENNEIKKNNNKDEDNINHNNNKNIDRSLHNNINSNSENENNKIISNKFLLEKIMGKNDENPKNSGNSSNRILNSLEKNNNKEKYDKIKKTKNNSISNNNKNIIKYNYNVIQNEEKKENNNEKFINNFISKNNHEKKNNEKTPNLLEKILNSQNMNKIEKDFISNNKNFVDKYENRENKNNLKNSYQFRIRKINLPMGLNLASIQHNNKLLQNIINKKQNKNKNKKVVNSNKIFVAQTEYELMKDEKNLYKNNEKKKKIK